MTIKCKKNDISLAMLAGSVIKYDMNCPAGNEVGKNKSGTQSG